MTLATTRRGRTLAKRMAQHVARVLASPLKGVYSTHIDSAQQFGRHWHDTYGFGFLEHGAQEWFSGRGIVRGYCPAAGCGGRDHRRRAGAWGCDRLAPPDRGWYCDRHAAAGDLDHPGRRASAAGRLQWPRRLTGNER